MINKNVAIAAIARNCADNLSDNIERIRELRRCFADSVVFLYENNSTDDTKTILTDWKNSDESVFLKSEDIDEIPYKTNKKVSRLYRGTDEGRIRKMCDCRNKLLDMINNYGSFDYVIFIDIDIEWFSVDGIIKSIEKAPNGWGGLFSNCYVTYKNGNQTFDFPMHYDTFAFLRKGKTPEQISYSNLNIIFRQFLSSWLYKKVNRTNYYECESAFGGVGIYVGSSLDNLRYQNYKPASWNDVNSSLCEHIYFNSQIKGGKYISKDLRVCYNYFEVKGVKWFIIRYLPFIFNLTGTLKCLIKN